MTLLSHFCFIIFNLTLKYYHALQEGMPKRWALSCHYLTKPFRTIFILLYNTFLVRWKVIIQEISNVNHVWNCHGFLLTLCADNSLLRGFGMGERCSFFHMALIGLILRNTAGTKGFEYSEGTPWIQQSVNKWTKVFLSISSINAMWKNEPISPLLKPLTTVLSARSVNIKFYC